MQEPAIRVLHHWACSGGTILSRCLAAMPEVVLLSEVHPLSYLRLHDPSSLYAPTDLIQQLCLPHNHPDPALCVATWTGAIDALQGQLTQEHKVLVLRSHSHIDFFTGVLPADEPLVSRSLSGRHRLRELLTVRHPLDSWLSIQAQLWDEHFRFSSFNAFCQRGMAMLEACSAMPVLHYEVFTVNPVSGLAAMAAALDLPHRPEILNHLDSVQLSGDSGRSHSQIGPRPRKPLNPDQSRTLEEALALPESTYLQLCARLGYNPDPAAAHPFLASPAVHHG